MNSQNNNSQSSANKKKKTRQPSVLESLKDLGTAPVKSLKGDVFEQGGRDMLSQMFGPRIPQVPRSGEISAGESVEMNDILSGKHESVLKLKNQLAFERKLRQEEQELRTKKSNELRLQLHAVMEEVVAISQTTETLSEELQVASTQTVVNPGVYHVIFFEKFLEFLKSYRKKVEEAATWLHASNKRAHKKNYWTKYEKHGSKFLLSADHYLTRSAG